ncbi:MAG: fumarate reductase/succinate dehydrogenase flavoprotein subunit [Candidatus Marinimicrobia bacterium]|mgnify:FL=1|jgi:succinate dehydrogenase / fumarate reductase flavoprotein subunit|nr:succinate dehydrogenase flavoprotein subunit [Candidatus Neomarinimicrobiota bacterium]MDP6500400.1 fumarate reductase/succinate dehydrogenase flavoprotein subunit [Candidatus Neomarinimicrobiota bacterium]MDP6726048.1 fumarate reductase/succinate dehydrogenase flavoprotein subunit [Candidatus Neomarinimicrobiota bacterium]|tara:strand:- start:55394 stop:57304 length:1911 start_codon:yes stop_codon:yes gene_type:complete
MLNNKIPSGPLAEKWTHHKFSSKLVNPSNKRKYDIIIVGTGLAGASAAASLAELGYNVQAFSYHESPRRAHSIAAQGGINAAKNYPNDSDSIYRLFYDTIKGGDYRSREANVYRLAEVSNNIIDQCVAQGIPFAREYGGLLDNRSFGGAQVSRTFYARGQTGQQLLLGAYSALVRQMNRGQVKFHPRHEMLDLVLIDGEAKGIVTRNLITGEIQSHSANAVVLATGGYGNAFFLSTNAMASNATAAWRAHKKGAFFANPCITQIHPTCIPVASGHQSKLTLMSESLRNDGRVWVPKKKGDKRHPSEITEDERDYYLERLYPSFGNLVPRDVASRRAKEMCDLGHGVGETGLAVFLDFADAIERMGKDVVVQKYGNLFDMYKQITGEDPYEIPMRIYPAVHYTMGGLWVDYNLMSTIPGLYILGEANFSDHGANRLGASALMQGLADGYFILPYTIGDYLSGKLGEVVSIENEAFSKTESDVKNRINNLISINGNRTVDDIHKELGLILWENVGMARNKSGLEKAIDSIPKLKDEFWSNVKVTGVADELNPELEKAGRVADFLELGELMARDALNREESCGGHFREEHQTEENEAKRNDKDFSFVAAWEHKGNNLPAELHKEKLIFENVELTTRSYK